MRRGCLILALAMPLAACTPDPDGQHPVSGEAVPAQAGPERPPEAHMEGQYALAAVEGQTLPATIERDERCRTEIVDGALRVEAGRFAFQNRVREVCGPLEPAEPAMHAAGGTVMIDGDRVVLEADVGQAFSRAEGVADESSITLRRLSTQEGSITVNWRFERHGAQSVPVSGTEDRTS
jgi:hypothetical protein